MVEREQMTWGYPRLRPYAILASVAFLGAIQSFAVALQPPVPDANRAAYVTVALLSCALGLGLVTVGPRIGPSILSAVALIATALVAAVAAVARTSDGQMLAGFSMLMLGVYSAYFLGAYSRRGLEGGATLAHDIDARTHHATAIVEIDLDDFKEFNDAHGHGAGDALLTDVVHAWRGVLRRTDILARTGGDEFVLILPATGPAEAQALIDRMRSVADVPWTAGLAEWQQGEPLPVALRHADDQMYLHKHAATRAADN